MATDICRTGARVLRVSGRFPGEGMHLRVDVSLVAFFSLFEVKQKKTGFFFVGGGWMKDGRKGD